MKNLCHYMKICKYKISGKCSIIKYNCAFLNPKPIKGRRPVFMLKRFKETLKRKEVI